MSNLCQASETEFFKILYISLDLDYLMESDAANKFLKEVEPFL